MAKFKDTWIEEFVEYVENKNITNDMRIIERLVKEYGEVGLSKRITAVKYKTLVKKVTKKYKRI